MKFSKKVWKWFDKLLPQLWGGLLVLIITGFLGAALIAVTKWILVLLGVA